MARGAAAAPLTRSGLRFRGADLLRGLWFVPGLVVLGFVALAFGVIAVDRASGPDGVGWAFHGSAEAAREILATIAGSLITVSGLAFSVTILTLQLVSSQFTPRAVRGFLSDRVNQALAGTFAGVFVYCLIVLSAVRSDEADGEDGFLPALAVTLAIIGGVGGFAALLVFIHRIAQSGKVATIASKAAHDALSAIDRLYPDPVRPSPTDGAGGGASVVGRWRADAEPARVRAQRPGYVQALDVDEVVASCGDEVRVHVPVRPGDFVTDRDPLVEIWPADGVDERAAQSIARAFHIANERDAQQDPAYGVRQLVDIALRAISPAVNDPTTALNCIGYVAAAVARLAGRELPPAVRRIDGSDVVLATVGFGEYVEQGFVELSRYANGDARVVSALLDGLAAVATAARDAGADARAAVAVAAAEDVAAPALEDARTARDRDRIAERLELVRRGARAAGG